MAGVLITVLFSLCAGLAGSVLYGRWLGSLDPAERIGVGGLLGLASVGLVTLFVGLVPGGLGFGLYFVWALVLVGAGIAVSRGRLSDFRFKSEGSYDMLGGLALVVVGLIALIAVLAPSVTSDWDSIAYHLAVPKQWLEAGQIFSVRGIHHSNFPASIDNLFIWGLKWGDQSGAKAFSLMIYVFGCAALFGLARRWYSRSAGWWAAIGFAGIPVVAWESGTAYIDVAHGLFAALGILYAMEAFKNSDKEQKRGFILAGLCLGFAMGTKYTGLQVLFAVLAVLGFGCLVVKDIKLGIRAKVTVALVALLIACPWYIKTAVVKGNPVYPFFSSVLGGDDWDEWRTSIYTDEQKSFGIGTSPAGIGHAVLGLGYMPGRYTNPGQQEGRGFPTGALGFAALLGGVGACLCGRLRREEKMVLAAVGIGFLMWFALSQQSRYLTMLAIPLAVLGAGVVSRVSWGRVVAGGFVLQVLMTVWMINKLQTNIQIQVVSGKIDAELYKEAAIPSWDGIQAINSLPEDSKVVLYDEVFGFYIDRDYFWGNPGHSMMIPYESLEDGDGYADALLDLGFTHVYLNAINMSQAELLRFTNPGLSYSGQESLDWDSHADDLNFKWKILMHDALLKERLVRVEPLKRAALYRIVR